MARTKRPKLHRIRPSWRVACQLARLESYRTGVGIHEGETGEKQTPIPALKRKIQQIWANVEEESVQKQADGMQKRLKSIIKSGGEFTAN